MEELEILCKDAKLSGEPGLKYKCGLHEMYCLSPKSKYCLIRDNHYGDIGIITEENDYKFRTG